VERKNLFYPKITKNKKNDSKIALNVNLEKQSFSFMHALLSIYRD
jgi:hypothetical protein